MSQEIKTFTISVYTENNIGLLNRISAIFQRRHINIESLTTSQSEIKNVNRFVIVVKITEEQDLLFDEPQIQNIIKESDSRIVTVNKEFFVLEKTGRRFEIEALREKFEVYGIMQFVRSGRIAVTKDEMKVSEILEAFKNQ